VRRKRETVSWSEEGPSIFCETGTTLCACFLYAPTEDKVRRLLVRGKTENEAHELVDTVDRERADFIAKYFGVDWPNLPLYHTMINTSIGDGAVIQAIANFMKICDARLTGVG